MKMYPNFINILKENNLKVYLVGGSVRDKLLGIEPKDYDFLVIGSTLDVIAELIKPFGKVDLVGKSFGVIKLQADGLEYDIAVPRKEYKTGENHTSFIVETKNVTLEEDLYRRDFTCNSIAYNIFTNEYIDPYNGLNDIKNKVLQITNPLAFNEDSLRILRCIQFSSRFGFAISEETLSLINLNKHNLNHISGERIIIELDKIFHKGDIHLGIMLLNELDLLTALDFIEPNTIQFHLISKIKTRADFYYVLFGNTDINILTDKLHLDNNLCNHIYYLQKVYNKIHSIKDIFEYTNKDKYYLTNNTYPSYLTNIVNDFKQSKYPRSYKELDVNGYDLMELGFSGKDIKDKLDICLHNVFNGFENKKEILLGLL